MHTPNDYATGLKRLAWRLQYQERRRTGREYSFYEEMKQPAYRMEEETVTRLELEELVAGLPGAAGREVIMGLYFRDRTEKQLALEMNMSQQAVNKWKRNMLKQLSQKMNSLT
ncbi:hypothetical protein [Paenibacillus sp. 1P07SE]|uniref:hypothetical protein n=1 Tax=Paenibacillus sp. 1P07SE TaxID=3132209 RepID=UPI0039A755AC